MPSAEHEKLAKKVYGIFDRGEVDRLPEVFHPDFVEHETTLGLPPGIPGVRAYIETFRTAFPDWHFQVERVISDGDYAACVTTLTGTHKGELMGIAPSGRRIETTVMDAVRIKDGKVIEHWGAVDSGYLMQQIGAAPAVPQQGQIRLDEPARQR